MRLATTLLQQRSAMETIQLTLFFSIPFFRYQHNQSCSVLSAHVSPFFVCSCDHGSHKMAATLVPCNEWAFGRTKKWFFQSTTSCFFPPALVLRPSTQSLECCKRKQAKQLGDRKHQKAQSSVDHLQNGSKGSHWTDIERSKHSKTNSGTDSG